MTLFWLAFATQVVGQNMVLVPKIAPANKTLNISLINNIAKPLTAAAPIPYKPAKNMPAAYSYTQGKLPMFCALEDLIWRRTGLGMQFRLIDRPLGFRLP